MKNKYILGIALIAIMVLSVAFLPGVLAKPPQVEPGQKMVYKINIIGVPKAQLEEGEVLSFSPGAEKGSGRRIFIPLETTYYTDPCLTNEWHSNKYPTDPSITDPFYEVTEPTKGVRISISEGKFDITDGNAIDGDASFKMPNASYDVYIVAKGKPMKNGEYSACLDLEAYTYNKTGDLIYIGMIDVDRKKGKPSWKVMNELLYMNGNGNAYFADPYDGYFWQLYNNGVKNMEVRFYERVA